MTSGTVDETVAQLVTSINTMLYGMEDAVQPIVDRLTEATHADLDTVADAVAPIVQRAVAATDVTLPGEVHGDHSTPGLARIMNDVNATIGDSELHVAAITDRAVNALDLSLGNLTTSVTDVVGAILGALSDLVNGLFGSLAEAPELWQSLTDIVGQMLTDHQDAVFTWLSALGSTIGHDIASSEFLPHEGIIPLPDDDGEMAPISGQSTDDYNRAFNQQPALIQAFINVVSIILGTVGYLNDRNAAAHARLQQSSLMEGLTTPLSVSQLVALVRRGEVGEGWAKDHAKRTGVPPELFDLIHTLTRAYLTPDNYVELWRRTGDDSQLDNLRKLGISDDDVGKLRTLAFAIPTPTDLVRFMVRDIYDPNVVLRDKLDDEFEDKVKDAPWRQVGVELDTLKQYWMSHWQLPSPGMMYEMLHRGLMDNPTLVQSLKQADWAPGWIDRLVAISYIVPGRIDIRRMFAAGIITTHEELVTRYQHLGYSPEDAETMAQFTETIKAKQDSADADRLHAPIANEIIRSYAAGGLAYDEAHGDLTGLGFTDEVATYRLQLGIFERNRDRSQRIRDSVHRMYVQGETDEGNARERLGSYGFESTEIDSLMDSWSLDLELKGWSDEKKHQRDLSKSETIEAYRDGLISDTAAHDALVSLGYDGDEAATLVALENARQQRADAKTVEQAVKTEFLTRKIEAQDAINTLRGFGIREQRITSLMTVWEIEREERRPDISPSLLERMLMQGIVDQGTIHQRLLDAGYTDGDASLLLTLYGTDMSVAADTLTEKRREFDARQQQTRELTTRRLDLTQRGQDLQTGRFTAAQSAVQRRFDAAQQQQATLSQARIAASQTAQNTRIAAQTARDAAQFAARREQQAKQVEAASARADKAIAAANARQQVAIAQQNSLQAQRAQLAAQAQQVQSTLQAQRLQSQATLLDKRIEASRTAAQSAAANARDLTDLRAAHQTDLTMLKAQIQQARDVATQASRVAEDNRKEQQRIRQEQRSSASKTITSGQAQQQQAALQSLQLQQSAAVAQVTAQFATLQAQLADQRQQTAAALVDAARQSLAAATPANTLIETTT